MTLGEKIRELRRERCLTQRQLAAMTGVDYSYLSKIENDRLEHTPSLRTLKDLALALSTDEIDLMDRANKVPSAFAALADNKEAVRFFRRAAETLTTPEQWQAHLDLLELQNRNKPG